MAENMLSLNVNLDTTEAEKNAGEFRERLNKIIDNMSEEASRKISNGIANAVREFNKSKNDDGKIRETISSLETILNLTQLIAKNDKDTLQEPLKFGKQEINKVEDLKKVLGDLHKTYGVVQKDMLELTEGISPKIGESVKKVQSDLKKEIGKLLNAGKYEESIPLIVDFEVSKRSFNQSQKKFSKNFDPEVLRDFSNVKIDESIINEMLTGKKLKKGEVSEKATEVLNEIAKIWNNQIKTQEIDFGGLQSEFVKSISQSLLNDDSTISKNLAKSFGDIAFQYEEGRNNVKKALKSYADAYNSGSEEISSSALNVKKAIREWTELGGSQKNVEDIINNMNSGLSTGFKISLQDINENISGLKEYKDLISDTFDKKGVRIRKLNIDEGFANAISDTTNVDNATQHYESLKEVILRLEQAYDYLSADEFNRMLSASGISIDDIQKKLAAIAPIISNDEKAAESFASDFESLQNVIGQLFGSGKQNLSTLLSAASSGAVVGIVNSSENSNGGNSENNKSDNISDNVGKQILDKVSSIDTHIANLDDKFKNFTPETLGKALAANPIKVDNKKDEFPKSTTKGTQIASIDKSNEEIEKQLKIEQKKAIVQQIKGLSDRLNNSYFGYSKVTKATTIEELRALESMAQETKKILDEYDKIIQDYKQKGLADSKDDEILNRYKLTKNSSENAIQNYQLAVKNAENFIERINGINQDILNLTNSSNKQDDVDNILNKVRNLIRPNSKDSTGRTILPKNNYLNNQIYSAKSINIDGQSISVKFNQNSDRPDNDTNKAIKEALLSYVEKISNDKSDSNTENETKKISEHTEQVKKDTVAVEENTAAKEKAVQTVTENTEKRQEIVAPLSSEIKTLAVTEDAINALKTQIETGLNTEPVIKLSLLETVPETISSFKEQIENNLNNGNPIKIENFQIENIERIFAYTGENALSKLVKIWSDGVNVQRTIGSVENERVAFGNINSNYTSNVSVADEIGGVRRKVIDSLYNYVKNECTEITDFFHSHPDKTAALSPEDLQIALDVFVKKGVERFHAVAQNEIASVDFSNVKSNSESFEKWKENFQKLINEYIIQADKIMEQYQLSNTGTDLVSSIKNTSYDKSYSNPESMSDLLSTMINKINESNKREKKANPEIHSKIAEMTKTFISTLNKNDLDNDSVYKSYDLIVEHINQKVKAKLYDDKKYDNNQIDKTITTFTDSLFDYLQKMTTSNQGQDKINQINDKMQIALNEALMKLAKQYNIQDMFKVQSIDDYLKDNPINIGAKGASAGTVSATISSLDVDDAAIDTLRTQIQDKLNSAPITLTNIKPSTIGDSGIQTGENIGQEAAAFSQIQQAVEAVTAAINEKTEAIKTESTTLDAESQKEIEYLNNIKTAFEALKTEINKQIELKLTVADIEKSKQKIESFKTDIQSKLNSEPYIDITTFKASGIENLKEDITQKLKDVSVTVKASKTGMESLNVNNIKADADSIVKMKDAIQSGLNKKPPISISNITVTDTAKLKDVISKGLTKIPVTVDTSKADLSKLSVKDITLNTEAIAAIKSKIEKGLNNVKIESLSVTAKAIQDAFVGKVKNIKVESIKIPSTVLKSEVENGIKNVKIENIKVDTANLKNNIQTALNSGSPIDITNISASGVNALKAQIAEKFKGIPITVDTAKTNLDSFNIKNIGLDKDTIPNLKSKIEAGIDNAKIANISTGDKTISNLKESIQTGIGKIKLELKVPNDKSLQDKITKIEEIGKAFNNASDAVQKYTESLRADNELIKNMQVACKEIANSLGKIPKDIREKAVNQATTSTSTSNRTSKAPTEKQLNAYNNLRNKIETSMIDMVQSLPNNSEIRKKFDDLWNKWQPKADEKSAKAIAEWTVNVRSLLKEYNQLKKEIEQINNLNIQTSTNLSDAEKTVLTSNYKDFAKAQIRAVQKYNGDIPGVTSANHIGEIKNKYNEILQLINQIGTNENEFTAENIEKLEKMKAEIADMVNTIKHSGNNDKPFGFDIADMERQLKSIQDKMTAMRNTSLNGDINSLMQQLANIKGKDIAAMNIEDLRSLENEINNIKKVFNDLQNSQKQLSSDTSLSVTTSKIEAKFNDLINKMNQYKVLNSKFMRDQSMAAQFNSIMNSLQTMPRNADNFHRLDAQVKAFKDTVTSRGLTGRSIGDELAYIAQKIGLKALLGNQIYRVIGYFRKMITVVKELDKEMTVLKRVTDESSEAYSKFFKNAKKEAAQVGATVSDVVNATAEFSKLGYNLEEATSLGKSAVTYANVGFMDAATAIESLSSVIQGFKISADESMSVVDKMDIIGKNVA